MPAFTLSELQQLESTLPPAQAIGLAQKIMDMQVPNIATYASDGAIAFTYPKNIAKLTKGSAGAYTLAAPTAAQEGYELEILCQSAFAHVVTATNLLDDGVTGGAKDTATFGAFVGSSLTLRAINLKWHVTAINVCTIAAV